MASSITSYLTMTGIHSSEKNILSNPDDPETTLAYAHLQYYRTGRKRLGLAILITGLVMLIEVIGGLLSNSLALVSDAGHMLTHLFALGMSFFAIAIAARPATKEKTYGFYRTEVLAALVNGIFLLFLAAFIFYQAVRRFGTPPPIAEREMLIVAIIGLIANGASIFLLGGIGRKDINIRSAFLHVIGDTISSVVVVIGGFIIYRTGNFIIDPILSMLICLLIVIWAIRLLIDSVNILLEATPKDIDIDVVAKRIKENIAEAREVHDIHVWVITSHMYAMTAHVLMNDCTISKSQEVLKKINELVSKEFSIGHTNIQFECYSP